MSEDKEESEQEPEPGILLVLFDINGSRDENNNNENNDSENLLENPKRIIKEFFSSHQISNLETQQLKPSELLYKFKNDLYDSSLFQMVIINNLSFIHEISLEADGFLIFLNLEDEKTEEKLSYLIKFMSESCCLGEKKITFVGLYKNEILPQFKKEELEIFFGDSINFDYYEIKYDIKDNEKKHNCMYETTNKKKSNKNKVEKKEKKELNLLEIIEKVTIDAYENKMSVIYIPDKKKFIKKDDKNNDNSHSRCIII